MNAKRFAIGTLAGGITDFLVGFLFWGVLFKGFMSANAGTATGVMKDPPDMLILFLGCLCTGALITYIYDNWAGIKTFMTGAKGGAIIGALMGGGHSLIQLSTTNLSTMNATLMAIVIYAVSTAIVGGVVGLVLGKIK